MSRDKAAEFHARRKNTESSLNKGSCTLTPEAATVAIMELRAELAALRKEIEALKWEITCSKPDIACSRTSTSTVWIPIPKKVGKK